MTRMGAVIFSIALICVVPSYRRALLQLPCSRDAYIVVPVTLSAEALNVLANLVVGFAGLMAPLALVSIVTGLHPFFLLTYGILLTRLLTSFGRERLSHRHLLQKLVAIGVMRAGMVLTLSE